jgi:hypothetical protein
MKVLVFIFLLFRADILFSDQKRVELENNISDEVELQGRFIIKDFFGPPNYGETPEIDKLEIYYIFSLCKPIEVNINGYIKNILKLQVIFNNNGNKNIDFNLIYEINGNLLKAQSGHHHTEVVVLLNSLNIFQ